MYDELVQRLREHNGWALNKTLDEAADAIEELEFACNRYEKDYKDLCTYLPKWIPTTERLPNDKREVQITVFWHDEWRTMYGYHDGAHWNLYAPMHTTDMPTNYDRCVVVLPYRKVATEMDGDNFYATCPELVEISEACVIGWMEKPTPMPLPDAQKEE